jgi:hypothetical protein
LFQKFHPDFKKFSQRFGFQQIIAKVKNWHACSEGIAEENQYRRNLFKLQSFTFTLNIEELFDSDMVVL